MEITPATTAEIDELLPLMRGYCEFYESSPSDDGLREMAEALIADPDQGALFIARSPEGEPVGFATLGWKWSSTRGSKIGYLEDLFVDPGHRGGGYAEALIRACAERCRERGAPVLLWMTAPDNRRARAVYERVGAKGSEWVEYELGL